MFERLAIMRIFPTASLLGAWFVATICLAGGTSAADPMAPIHPAASKGPVRVACIGDSITEVPDKVHPNIDGHREMANAALVVLTGMSAEPRNLVPAEPGKSPNYWCTWSAQSDMQGQCGKDNDPILYQVA